MRLLFEIDTKDYKRDGTITVRPSVRGIIIKDRKIAMVHSIKYDYYKLPGGGMNAGETQVETLIREIYEETGIIIKPASIIEYGLVHRIQKGTEEDIFIQDNFHYLCDIMEETGSQSLDDYEEEEQFTLEYVSPEQIIETNRNHDHGEMNSDMFFQQMIAREVRVMECLIDEGYFQ